MGKWIIDKKIMVLAGRLKAISYQNTSQKAKVKAFSIYTFKDERISIYIESQHEALRDKLLSVCENSGHAFAYENQPRHFVITFKNTALLCALIQIIHQCEPLNHLVKQNLLEKFNVMLPTDVDEMITVASQGNFEKAFSMAKRSDDKSAVWLLGQYYEQQDSNLQQAIDCYQAITPENAHYKSANFHIAGIILQLLSAEKEKAIRLTADVMKAYKTRYLEHLLLANDAQVQPIIDRYFDVWCGGNGMNPAIRDVGVNLTTLLKTADRLQTLNSQVATLQAQVLRLSAYSANQAESIPYFQLLPQELFLHILSYLEATSLSLLGMTDNAYLTLMLSRLAAQYQPLIIQAHDDFALCATPKHLYCYSNGRDEHGKLMFINQTESETDLDSEEESDRSIHATWEQMPDVPGNILQVGASVYNALVLTDQGLYVRGANYQGELGLGHQRECKTWVKNDRLPGKILQIAIGAAYNLFILTDTGLYAYGENNFGELGDETDAEDKVLGVPGKIQQVILGSSHTLVLSDQGLYGCGDNQYGQLGLGYEDRRVGWTKLEGFSGTIQQVVAGSAHTLVLTDQGLYGCGYNYFGQLGLGHNQNCNQWAKLYNPASKIQQIFAGGAHTFLLTEQGLFGCGQNSEGQLGLKDYVNRNGWTLLNNYQGQFQTLSAGSIHTLLLTRQKLYHFGERTFYGLVKQLPDEIQQNIRLNAAISRLETLANAIKLSAFKRSLLTWYALPVELKHHIINYLDDASVGMLAITDKQQLGTLLPLLESRVSAMQISLGAQQNRTWCETFNALYSCGSDSNMFGINHTRHLLKFKPAQGLSGRQIQQVAVGGWGQVMVLTEAGLYACGSNYYGMLGLGDEQARSSFTQVNGLPQEPIQQVIAGLGYSLIVTEKALYFTGGNRYDQSEGQPRRLTFTQVESLPAGRIILQVALGNNHTLVLMEQGLYASGNNVYGQLGLGTTQSPRGFSKVEALPMGKIQQVVAAKNRSLLVIDDKLYICGIRLADNHHEVTFTQVNHLPSGKIHQVIAYEFNIFVVVDQTLYAYGDNYSGQLGLRDMVDSFSPVEGLPQGKIQQVVTNEKNTLVLMEQGLYVCGKNKYGQLGLGHNNDVCYTFMKVHTLPPGNILQVVAGENHTLVLMDDGIYACGKNKYGQLGMGDVEPRNTFTKVENLPDLLKHYFATKQHFKKLGQVGPRFFTTNAHRKPLKRKHDDATAAIEELSDLPVSATKKMKF